MKTILILRFSAMGDAAIAASVMKEIAAQNPDIRFVFATRAFFDPFFDGVSNLEVFPVDFKKIYKGLKGLLRLYKDLNKNYKIDAIADLHDVLRSKLLTLCFRLSFNKIKIATINKGRKEKRALCYGETQKTPLKSTWQRYTEVFQQLKIKAVVKPAPIPFLPEKVKKIGVSPFAQHKGKVYPPELMEKVLELLNDNYEVYLFGGGKKEQELCEKWQTKYSNVYSLVGKKTLVEELEFISTLDVMLSMDSSGMHLASLCGIPCVSVWGATHPYSGFVGFGQENNPQIQLELPCRPCSVYGNKPCKYKNYRCLYEISPEEIVNSLKF
ncbi:MAG: glycosyltransferase family 9 protein [Bacteroidetes bacterium]|nr:glycosyltransferase family 9 protein [Bacteroidota bacterium]MCL2303266.1 glycosyltransferase family 9 protein [Lentimicrobiaceae bacterium]